MSAAAEGKEDGRLEVLYEHVSGIDVHRASLSVCVRHAQANGRARQEVWTFRTMTRDLLALRDGLEAEGVTHVAMEATGVLAVSLHLQSVRLPDRPAR